MRNSREAEPEDGDSEAGFSVKPSSLKNKEGRAMSIVLPANQVCSILRVMCSVRVGGNKTAPTSLTVPVPYPIFTPPYSQIFFYIYLFIQIQENFSYFISMQVDFPSQLSQ